VNVYLPKDRVTNQHQGYGFVEFRTEDDADYVRTWPLAIFCPARAAAEGIIHGLTERAAL
jgi:RNA recognition motif. (a.k.a. RRM, RBD, or RNP domain)